jgi:hypothetical protein
MIKSSARLGRHRWRIERTGPGLAASGGCASATSAARNASTRWPCWPARSSASTRSDSHHGDEPSTDPMARSMMQGCQDHTCVGAFKGRLPRDAGTACPSVRRGMAGVLPPSRATSSRLEAGFRHKVCCRHGAGFHLTGRSHGWMSCPGGCRCVVRAPADRPLRHAWMPRATTRKTQPHVSLPPGGVAITTGKLSKPGDGVGAANPNTRLTCRSPAPRTIVPGSSVGAASCPWP